MINFFLCLGSVLAHAFYPEEHLGGDVHYDEDEDWTAYRENEYGLSKILNFNK